MLFQKIPTKNQSPEEIESVQRQPKQVRTFEQKSDLGGWSSLRLSPNFTDRYGSGLARRLRHWWLQRVPPANDINDTVQWILFAHLYVDYQLTVGCPGPYLIDKKIVDPLTRPFLDIARTLFHTRVRWFRSFLLWFFQYHGISVGLAICRCVSQVLKSHLASASIKWDQWCLGVAMFEGIECATHSAIGGSKPWNGNSSAVTVMIRPAWNKSPSLRT